MEKTKLVSTDIFVLPNWNQKGIVVNEHNKMVITVVEIGIGIVSETVIYGNRKEYNRTHTSHCADCLEINL